MNKLWFADTVTDIMSSDQADHAKEKVPSCDRTGLNYGFWCYMQDTEHSTDEDHLQRKRSAKPFRL